MRRDSPRYGNFPKRRKSRERPWNRASPAFGKLWEHVGKYRVDLGNNPEYSTARDIVEVRQIKANLVSVNVDRLVKDGYLSRKEVAGDRRKTQLLCTKKAAPVIKKGQALQQDFADRLIADLDDATKDAFFKGMAQMETTLDMILEEVS